MTASKHRTVRLCAITLSLSLITGTITQSSLFAKQRRENTTVSEQQADSNVLTLELRPASTVPPITNTLIMRLVNEAEKSDTGLVETASASSELVSKLHSDAVQHALRLRGSRYVFGGTSRGGFDCSGFTRYVYARLGIGLPRTAAEQFGCGKTISRSQLRPGDLVFFSRAGHTIGHVGIYIGNSRFVHASNPRRGVTVDSLNSSYYTSHYKGARRLRDA